MLPDEILALISLKRPSELVGYMNVYDYGDIWEKIKGCDGCENNCCKNCPIYMEDLGCRLHILNMGQDKPVHCVIQPSPLKHRADCLLEYKCTKGIHIGRIRKQSDPKNVLRDEETGEKIKVQ